MRIDEGLRTNLLTIADAYGKAKGLSLASVSRKFHGNQAFLKAFKAGTCSVTIDKAGEMVEAFREAWPQGLDWPVVRPLWM